MTRLLPLLLLLAGCVAPNAMTHDADRTNVVVRVKWSTPEQISALCGGSTPMWSVQACWLDTGFIVMQKPRDFDDHERLETLGHEIFHGLGARHDHSR